jgi:ABC-2 type transport system ATP-binding protein
MAQSLPGRFAAQTDQPSPEAAADQPMVDVRGLVKRYGKQIAVDGISFAIQRGEIFGILGPNGAGKTTTLEIIEGIRSADAGDVLVDGLNVRRQRREVQARIGVQLQATTLFEQLTVRETLSLFGAFFPSTLDPDTLLRDVALEEKAGAYPPDLSGGQRQRLALALGLVNDPIVVFLDEPTSGLDPQSRRMLWNMVLRLRQQGKTIVLTTHYMEEAQILCDRVAVMDHGQIIAADTPAQLIATLGASATIECTLEGGALADDELRLLPGVTDTRPGSERMLIYTSALEPTLTALLQAVSARGASLEHLQVHAPTLEDVFLKLTGRALRD